MDSAKIEQWIKNLGKTHKELIAEQSIQKSDLMELFPGIDELSYAPTVGIEMQFCWETERFESLFITLIKSTPSTLPYQGALPPPYSNTMNQSLVHELFGKPLYASGPLKMPEPMGKTGGWESYTLDESIYANTKVVFQYLESMDVHEIIFMLIEKDHDHP